MSQYTRKDPPWSHVGVPGAGLNQTLIQQNQSLLGAQPGVVGTPTTNVYGQSMVSNTGLGAAGATTAYPTPQQTMQQRQNIALQQQQAAAQNAAAAAAAAGSQGGGTPQLTVSYPTTRATQGGQPRQRVFTGTVTKLHDTFGFVDEDVFFQTNTVKGSMPKIGERVLVEATYNASMPFKWNATRIQLLNSPLEQQVAQPPPPQQQQHHAAMKMQQLKQMQQQQQPSRIESVSQQFKMLKQSQQPLLKAPQASNMMPTHSQPPPPGLLGNPPPLLQQPPGVVQQPPLLQGNAQAMQNLAGAYAHQGRTSQIGQQSMSRRDFSSSGSRDRDRDRDRERERDRAQREREREREREHRERERERERERRERDRVREREKSPVKKRSRSPRRSKSPRRSPRRTKRLVQRYCVQIPRFALDIPKSDVIELHKRYMNMYIPSDFFLANFAWQDVFPIYRPMNVAQPCTFHIMHKEAPPPQGAATVIDPPDASYSYCAKVMLMTSVSQEELYEKCCARAQDSSEVRDNFQHPTRLINFLVGQKGKNEVMAIGGPWSPSLDGADPVNDTSVLIKTAIRTTKALTGIDLTSCTQWYRFLDLSYHRPEEIHKGRVIPARVETVVIFVPDVWHILPTKVEWESLTELYKKTLSSKLAAVDNRDKKMEDTAPTQDEPAAKEEEEEDKADEQEHQTPTNWKELDPKNMKVNELRQELEIRGLNSKGLKSQLIARLTKMLKSEQEMEDAEPDAMETDAAPEDAKEEPKDAPKEEEVAEKDKKDKEEKEKKEKEDDKKREIVEEEKRRQREREKRDLETRYMMPEGPSILVHPSPIAKSGKFDCTQQSLSVLLDYRVEDNKEHSFEVFLFAELFNEMLQRDFAFNMYKAIYRAPEKKEEKKDDKKKDKDKKDEKEKKDDKKDDKDEKKEDKKEDEPKSKRRKTEEKDADKEDCKDKDEERKEEDSKEDDKDGEEEENDGKSNEDDADDDDKKRGDKKSKDDKSKLRVKMETHDPHLLLSCIYFDQNHCGYILERDLEEILYTVGLHLSRAQVRKLLQKVVNRDCWSYRKLTDGPKKEKDDTTKATDVNNVPSDADLAKGNQMILDNMASSKKGSKGMAPDGVTMVKYGGTVIDIANLLKQVQKADQERSMAEKKIESLEKQIETLKSKASSSEATVTNVSGELLDVQKKLSTSERALLGSSTRSKKLIDVIGTAQKNLDEIMLKFNEVLEEAMLPPTVKVVEKVVEKGKEKEEPKVKTETKPTVKGEPKSPKVEK